MDLKKYQEIFKKFLDRRKEHPEEEGRKVPDDINQLVIGGIRTVKAAIMVFDIANSSEILDKMGKEKYLEWLGLGLHCFFHCVDEFGGFIDKYTGDGAMVSFSSGSEEKRCKNALNCAIGISNILSGILNPFFVSNGFKEMNLRIGIDFGFVSIERIGKKNLTHLILIGAPANNAKTLEERGKSLKFNYNCTICIGYDLFNIIGISDYKCDQEFGDIYYDSGTIEGVSSIDNSEPYKIYQYWCRKFIDDLKKE